MHNLNQSLLYTTPQDNYQNQARTVSDGFPQPQDRRPKPAPAPAVPSFGAPLPCCPSVAVPPGLPSKGGDSIALNQHKRKRSSNQLGLTPATEGYQDSEDEVGEVTSVTPLKDPVQFEYNGQTSVLGSAAEVTAWIAERKKRWPTKARVEEKQRDLSKQQEERTQARKKQQEEQAGLRRRLVNERSETRQKSDQAQTQHVSKKPSDETSSVALKDDRLQKSLEKHMLKVEKLRRKLEQKQAGIAYSQPSLRDGPECTMSPSEVRVQPDHELTSDSVTYPLSTTRIQTELHHLVKANNVEAAQRSGSSSSLDPVSSGSAYSDAQSDSDSDPTSMDSSAPEELISQTNQNPPRDGAPARQRAHKVMICRYFLQSGRCRAGEQCAFAHELPERGLARAWDTQSPRPVAKERRKERTSLYAELVAQELAREDKRLLDAIKYLGHAGMLGVQMGPVGQDKV